MSGQKQNASYEQNLNMYGFPATMSIYNLPDLWARKLQWTITVIVPTTFLVQVSGYNSLGERVRVKRQVGRLRVELILPISYQAERQLNYCFGVLVCPRPLSCWELLDLSMFLIPMAHGQPRVLHELHRLFSEHSRKLSAREQPPARRLVSARGRGRGSRRRGLATQPGTQKVETVDLEEEERGGSTRSTQPDNNNATRSEPTASNNSLLPNTSKNSSLVTQKSSGLSETNDIMSKINPITSAYLAHQEESTSVNIRNKFDNCQFHLSLGQQGFDLKNTRNSVLPNSYPTSFPAKGQNLNSHFSTMTPPGVPIAQSQNTAQLNSMVSLSANQNVSNNNQQLSYKPSNMIQTFSSGRTQNSLSTNFTSSPSTNQIYCSSSNQKSRYPSSNIIPSSVPLAHAQRAVFSNSMGGPSANQNCFSNSHNSLYPTSNMIPPSNPLAQAQRSYQNQPNISRYSLRESTVDQNTQNSMYNTTPMSRSWPKSNLQTENEESMGRGMFPSFPESHPSMVQNFNPPNYSYSDFSCSNPQGRQPPTFEEAVANRRPMNIYPTANDYNQSHMSLGSGFPTSLQYFQDEEFNQRRAFTDNQFANHGMRKANGNGQPSSYYSVSSGANSSGFSGYNPQNQSVNENSCFPNEGFGQTSLYNQYFSNNTNHQAVPNLRNENTQPTLLPVIENRFQKGTLDKSGEQCDKDDDYVNLLSNSSASSKSTVKRFTLNETGDNYQENAEVASIPVGIYKVVKLFDHESDHEDSNESALVIDEGRSNEKLLEEHQEGLDGNQNEPLGKQLAGETPFTLFSSLPNIAPYVDGQNNV